MLGLWATLITLHAAAALHQVGRWHMYPANYNYYYWNNKGSMIFVKGYQSNITISAWMSPKNQWVKTVPETQNTSTALVYVADNFKTVFMQVKMGTYNNVVSYAADTTLTLRHSGGLSPEAGEVGPPHCAVVGNQLFIAQRMTLAGQVIVGMVTDKLKWTTRTFVNTWGGGEPRATPVYCSPHGKYLAVERSYDTVQHLGTFDVYKTGTFKVFTPQLKLVGQAVGGPPLCQGRAVLLPDFSVSPHEFTIYRW